jgi:hypothetical protein
VHNFRITNYPEKQANTKSKNCLDEKKNNQNPSKFYMKLNIAIAQ